MEKVDLKTGDTVTVDGKKGFINYEIDFGTLNQNEKFYNIAFLRNSFPVGANLEQEICFSYEISYLEYVKIVLIEKYNCDKDLWILNFDKYPPYGGSQYYLNKEEDIIDIYRIYTHKEVKSILRIRENTFERKVLIEKNVAYKDEDDDDVTDYYQESDDNEPQYYHGQDDDDNLPF